MKRKVGLNLDMIKVRLYDYDCHCIIEVFTKLNSYDFWKKNCKIWTDKKLVNHGFLFLGWSSKKRNFNCWHYGVGKN